MEKPLFNFSILTGWKNTFTKNSSIPNNSENSFCTTWKSIFCSLRGVFKNYVIRKIVRLHAAIYSTPIVIHQLPNKMQDLLIAEYPCLQRVVDFLRQLASTNKTLCPNEELLAIYSVWPLGHNHKVLWALGQERMKRKNWNTAPLCNTNNKQ